MNAGMCSYSCEPLIAPFANSTKGCRPHFPLTKSQDNENAFHQGDAECK